MTITTVTIEGRPGERSNADRYFTLVDLEQFVARLRDAGGLDGTEVRAIRNGKTYSTRLEGEINA